MGEEERSHSSERSIKPLVSLLESGLIDDSMNVFSFIGGVLNELDMVEALSTTDDEKRETRENALKKLNTTLLSYEEYLAQQKFTPEEIEKILHSPLSNPANIERFNQIVREYNEAVEAHSITHEFAKSFLDKATVLIRG